MKSPGPWNNIYVSGKKNYRPCPRGHEKRTKYGRFIQADLRRLFYNEQGGRCFYCEKPFPKTDQPQKGKGKVMKASLFEIEHLEPISRGGTNWSYNIVLSCPRCNREKGTKTVEEYRQYLLQKKRTQHAKTFLIRKQVSRERDGKRSLTTGHGEGGYPERLEGARVNQASCAR